jgi:TonB family protein
MFDEVNEAVRAFDPHLVTILSLPAGGGLGLTIGPGITPQSVAMASGIQHPTPILVPPPPPPPSADALPPGVYKVGNGVLPPTFLSRVEPAYPKEIGSAAGISKVEGVVVLSCVIGIDGRPSQIQVVKSLAPEFDANAVEALSQWLFKPGTLNGVPVRVHANIEINFRKL